MADEIEGKDLTTFLEALEANKPARDALNDRVALRYRKGELPQQFLWLAQFPDLCTALIIDHARLFPRAKKDEPTEK